MKGWRRSRVIGVLLILLLLVLWEISSRTGMIDSPTWVPVSKVFIALWEMVMDGTLLKHVLATLKRMAMGYGIGVVLGVTVGLVMAYFRFMYNLLEPLVELLRPIPGPAYLPVLILFLGIDDTMKVVLVALASFFPIVLNTYGGVKAIDPVQRETAVTFGLTPFQTLREIIIPAASPQIFTGARISLAVSLILAVLAEMVASVDGLGFLTLDAQRTFRVPAMFASVFTLAIIGYALNRLFLLLESRVLRWHIESSGH